MNLANSLKKGLSTSPRDKYLYLIYYKQYNNFNTNSKGIRSYDFPKEIHIIRYMEKNAKGILELFLHKKPVGIIISLKDSDGKYASVLSKENDCTYTHTLKILTSLQNYGIVEFKKEGRIKGVKLTQVGEDIAHEFKGLVRHLERLSGKIPGNKEVSETEREE